MLEILSFLFFINLLIFVHELGHFLLAKKFKLPVLEFSLGFPPRVLSKKLGETSYSLGILPLGGYVKLKGEDNPQEEGFYSLKPLKRIVITSGGVVMNFILAFLLFSLSFLIAFPRPTNKIVISGFLPDSPFKNLLMKNDIIKSLEIDGQKYYFQNPQELSNLLKENLARNIVLEIERNNEILNLELRTPSEILPSGGVLGVYLTNFTFETKPFPSNFLYGLIESINFFLDIFSNTFKAILNLIKGEKVMVEVIGPIGIFSYYQNILSFGLGYILYFIGSLSLYLVFFNLLPLPALDGGRLIFFLYEVIRGRKINPKLESLIHQLGFYLLFILLVLITLKDILKFK